MVARTSLQAPKSRDVGKFGQVFTRGFFLPNAQCLRVETLGKVLSNETVNINTKNLPVYNQVAKKTKL